MIIFLIQFSTQSLSSLWFAPVSERQRQAILPLYSRAKGIFPQLQCPLCLFTPTPHLRLSWLGQHLIIPNLLLQSPHFPPLFLHELAHYNAPDITLHHFLALLPPWFTGFYTSIGLGIGCGPLLTHLFWLAYWRKRTYSADTFVASLGYKDALIHALEAIELPQERAKNKLFRSKPYTEERIAHLQSL